MKDFAAPEFEKTCIPPKDSLLRRLIDLHQVDG